MLMAYLWGYIVNAFLWYILWRIYASKRWGNICLIYLGHTFTSNALLSLWHTSFVFTLIVWPWTFLSNLSQSNSSWPSPRQEILCPEGERVGCMCLLGVGIKQVQCFIVLMWDRWRIEWRWAERTTERRDSSPQSLAAVCCVCSLLIAESRTSHTGWRGNIQSPQWHAGIPSGGLRLMASSSMSWRVLAPCSLAP